MQENKTLIFIPTYNEGENVEHIFSEIKKLQLGADILFLDDNSPDGTGKILDRISAADKNVFVIHRKGKLGIGSAHLQGIAWAYDRGYATLITMDCDFTHSPTYIFDFIKASSNADIVIGSRYIEKDSLKTWNLYRKILTRLGHFLTGLFLGMPYDSSGAFRLYKLHKIPPGIFSLVTSKSYSFFFESLFILNLNKFSIHEIPINLPSRTYGHSKMKFSDILKSLKYLVAMFLQKTFSRQKFIYKK